MEKNTCTHCGETNKINHKYCISCGYELPKIEIPIVESTPKESKKKPMGILIGSMVGLLVAVFAQQMVQRYVFGAPSNDKVMVEMANAINKSCPMIIDAATQLDNAVVLPNNVFQYNYTLLNIAVGDVDTLEMKRILEPQMLNAFKTNPQMKYIRDHKTTLDYYYKDKDANYVCRISITPQMYLD